ncbi:unnamed protein product [Schistosoma curassoni]|uniref:Transposase n=2 Tax=Schistosoma TaxID=6181 RepID=A0A183K381_9TREM|nr:unnamed protein product [Schistosoma curassoni]VDP40793.1 unnamed protein product [Schistosoma margrebowiei]
MLISNKVIDLPFEMLLKHQFQHIPTVYQHLQDDTPQIL